MLRHTRSVEASKSSMYVSYCRDESTARRVSGTRFLWRSIRGISAELASESATHSDQGGCFDRSFDTLGDKSNSGGLNVHCGDRISQCRPCLAD